MEFYLCLVFSLIIRGSLVQAQVGPLKIKQLQNNVAAFSFTCIPFIYKFRENSNIKSNIIAPFYSYA
mgnify:CR=1 FL=1